MSKKTKKASTGRHFTAEEKAKALEMVDRGMTYKKAGEAVGSSGSSVANWDKERREGGIVPKDRSASAQVPKDALVYLRHAKAEINKALRSGRIKEMDRAHLLTLLALDALENT